MRTLARLVVVAAIAQSPTAAHAQLPPPEARTIDFTRDIAPILKTSCVRCHARGRDRGGFSIETRERMLKGGDDGPALVPGDSASSHLIALVAGLDPDEVMPKKGSRLTSEQIGLLRAWIDQGAAWDPEVSFARPAPQNLVPRAPDLPADASLPANPVDRLLVSYLAQHDPTPTRLSGDRQFIRRATLDIVGELPTPEKVRAFVADRQAGKRARLVARLLADDRRYAEHWLTFWNDLLRNDYRGTGYIDGGRENITAWLYAALANNLPYDRFVAALVNPTPASEGFAKGIVWRGVVNASQTPEMQAAQNISQVFMGVNLKCASCHDSFINDWQLSDAYGLASIYASSPLEMVECDRPTGKKARMKFLYDELGTVDPSAPRGVRLEQLSHVLTGPQNGRLARTIVNRLWARFMGRGLVEPLDDMDRPAWDQDLLDWLAEDLVAHGYDLKHTMRVVLTSQAYSRQAVDVPERPEAYVFRGPAIRRLTAEQFVDGISAITGVWQEKQAAKVDMTLVSAHAAPVASRTRAALANADPLMTALGRPNREQVVTVRTSAATTLQALELENGSTLAAALRRGAEGLIKMRPPTTNALIDRVFVRAFSRPPTRTERALCTGLLGAHPTAAGVEDLLWSIAMLPEFQMVN